VNKAGLLVAILLALLSGACADVPGAPGGAAPIAAVRDSSHEILLTFADRGLLKTPNAAPGKYFRRASDPSDYQSTSWSRAMAADIAQEYSLVTIVEWPIRALGVHCVVYSVGDEQSVDGVIQRLVLDKRVEGVQRMNTFRALSSEDPYKSLQTSFGDMQVESAHRFTTGKGVSIAIIDTGVDLSHPDLAGQVIKHADLTHGDSAFNDDIHGTAVAGIIAAVSRNGVGIEGVAPDSRLFALRACWPEQRGALAAICNSLTLARALDTAISLKPQILNLSLTGPSDPLVEALLKAAQRAGIIVVAAEPSQGALAGFAAAIDGVIRVQAIGPAALESQSGESLIWAPGSEVLTTFPNGTYNFASGSSFAAANVSAIIALLLELRPTLSSREARLLLLAGSDNALDDRTEALPGCINVCHIVTGLRPDYICEDGRQAELLVQEETPIAQRVPGGPIWR
jgi:subtilisin family serine protease